MRNRALRTTLILLVAGFIKCGDSQKETRSPLEFIVNPGTDREIKMDTLSGKQVEVGRKLLIRYIGSNKDCDNCTFEWKRRDIVVGIGTELNIVFCNSGQENIIFRVLRDGEHEIEKLEINISVSSTEIKRTKDVEEAIGVFQKENFILGLSQQEDSKALDKIAWTISVIQKYVDSENSCDASAVYALALGKFVTIFSKIQEIVRTYFEGGLRKDDILYILDNEIKPLKRDIEALMSSGAIPSDFSFRVKNTQINIIRDFPETADVEKLYLNLSGEHDLTDYYFLASFIEFISGSFDVVLAYNLALEFILDIPARVTPRIGERRPLWRIIAEEFLRDIDKNPAFLGLSPDASTRLRYAQVSFYNALKNLQRMFDSLQKERDDQMDDIIRYWDCGKDGICPGDVEEPYADINGNGKWDSNEPYFDLNENDTWNSGWISKDSGEGNGVLDVGERFGTEKLKFTGSEKGVFISFSGDVGRIAYQSIFQRKVFDVVAQNIIGGILDIGKIAGQSNDSLKQLLCSVGLSFPEIRLWEFFVSPTPLRDLVPLRDPAEKTTIILQRDTEGIYDTGLDGKFSWDYGEYEPLRNPDPDLDDADLVANNSDDVDTNNNGKCANAEAYRAWERKSRGEEPKSGRDCINFVSSGKEDYDLGTESNFLFDWRDRNNNKKPDKGDISERWDDDGGIRNGRGGNCGDRNIKGNNEFDVCDSEHYWPDGRKEPKNTVGRGGLICPQGPYGGDDMEVVDLVYLLFPDPTFSGVLRFYKGEGGVVKNTDGEALTDNALLHRNIWRAVKVLNILENYPYR